MTPSHCQFTQSGSLNSERSSSGSLRNSIGDLIRPLRFERDRRRLQLPIEGIQAGLLMVALLASVLCVVSASSFICISSRRLDEVEALIGGLEAVQGGR